MRRLPVRTPEEISAALPHVIDQLRRDGLIAYPTETVYGFGGAVTPGATAALRHLKSRDVLKPFLLLITGPDQAPGVHWTETSRAIARHFWPGPLTLALPARVEAFPDGVVSAQGMVALRASPHPFVRALIGAWGGALTSTSANAPGIAPARDADDVETALRTMDAADVLVLDGGTLPESLSSTILSVEANEVRVLRVGAIGTDELRNQLSGIGIDVR